VNDSTKSDKSFRRPFVLVVAGIAGVVLVVLLGRCGSTKSVVLAQDAATFDDSESPVPVTFEDPFRGERDAPVTLVMFGNLQCPYTAKAQGILRELETTYGKHNLRIVWKTFVGTTHDKAREAAIAGNAVHRLRGSQAFFTFHDTTLRNQAFMSTASYENWGAEAGLEKLVLRGAIMEPKYAQKVSDDEALAKKLGVTRTPSYFLDGLAFDGSVALDRWKRAIDGELTKGNAKIAAGVPRNRVYVEVSKENWKSGQPAK
jgi:protein-disulfide isomerase